MKYKEIRELTDEELTKKLEEGRAELFNLRFQMATSQLDNTARVTNVKRDRQSEVDVALLCPHLEYPARDAVAKGKIRVPLFVLPMRMYGLVDIENLIEEAEDVIELYKNGADNVVTFPDEPRSMTAPRTISHRRWLAQQKR